MEEEINLATFTFDVDKLQANLNSLQDTMFALKKENELYANQMKLVQKGTSDLVKEQLRLIESGEELSAEYKENEKLISDLNESEKQLYKNQQNVVISQGRVRQEITATTTQLKAYMTAESQQTTLMQSANVALSKEIQNINQARASNTELLRVRNQLNPAIKEEAALITQLNQRLDSNNEFIKENASEYEKQKINIGNYTQSIKDAIGESGLLGGKLQQVTQVFQTFSPIFNTLNADIKNTINQMNFFGSSTQTAGTQATNTAQGTQQLTIAQKALAGGLNVATGATRVFTLALAATGIGLIIGAIILLISYFKTFDPIVDKLEQAFSAVGAAVRVFQQAIVSVFSSLENLGKFISDPIGSLKELAGAMGEAASAASNLKERQQELEDAQRAQSVANKKQEGEINRLMLQSKDRSKSEQERIDLLNKAEKINQDNFKQNQKLSQQQTDNAIESARISGKLNEQEMANLRKRGTEYAIFLLNEGKITEDEVNLIEDAENAKIEIYNRSTAEQEKIINRRNLQLEKQEAEAKKAAEEEEKRQQKAIENAKKRQDEAIKAMQTELDFYLESQGEGKKSMQEQLAIDKEVMRQSLAINKAEFEAKKLTRREYELANLEATNEFAKKQVDATIENANIELELFKLNNQKKIDENQFFSDELLAQEKKRINDIAIAEMAQQKLLFEKGKISAEQYGLEIRKIKETQKTENDEADAKALQAKKDQQAADILIQDELNAERFEYDLALQMERYNREYAERKAQAEKNGADMLAFEQNEANKKKLIEQTVQDNKLQLASQTLNNLSTLLGKESAAGKALAVMQTTMDTYRSATAAYASLAGIPIVGPTLGGIAAGVAVAAGLANVKKITAVKEAKAQKAPGYALGGKIVDGIPISRSNGDNVLIAAKRGEAILNESQQRAIGIGNLANAGVSGFSASGSSFVQNEITSNANNTAMAEMIAEAVQIGAERGTASGSEKGLTNLSDNRQIQENAKF